MTNMQNKETHENMANIKALLSLLLPAILVCVLLLPVSASAQDGCASIGESPEWINGMQKLIETVQASDMKSAKAQAKALAAICPNAPALNYLQGKIAKALGEKSEALYYYQKASENTYTFAVDPENAKKIWYARYENEHPERTADALASNSESFSALEAENEQLKEKLAQQEKFFANPKTLMWVGTGLGAGGLAFIGTGVGLLLTSHSSEITPGNNGYKIDDSAKHATGWVLTGVGAGLLVTGAVLAGIYGYKYKKSLTVNNDISLNISPTGFHFNMTF